MVTLNPDVMHAKSWRFAPTKHSNEIANTADLRTLDVFTVSINKPVRIAMVPTGVSMVSGSICVKSVGALVYAVTPGKNVIVRNARVHPFVSMVA